MKRTFVAEIREKDLVEAPFLVAEKALVQSRTGLRYIKLKLRDRTGEIEGRIWERVEESDRVFSKGDFVLVKAEAVRYQGTLQLNILELRTCSREEISLEDFVPTSKRHPEEMLAELRALASKILDPYLRRLVMSFLRDRAFLEAFAKAPASRGIHHARSGGLLEHTLSLAKLVERIRGHYEGVDWDLLLCGAILHDIGKVKEIEGDLLYDYSSEGKLLGHIVLGLEMLSERIKAIEGFPEDKAMLLKHLIISHHGREEWGSPKKPRTLEAELLHRLDDLDAKMDGILELIRKGEGEWTEFHRAFERSFWRGNLSEDPGGQEGTPAP